MPTYKCGDGTLIGWSYPELNQNHFPTEFAKSVLETVKLMDWDFFAGGTYHRYCDSTCENNHAECYWFERCYTAAGDFQRMSMGMPFEKCLLCYHGFDLTQTQIDALKIIHEATPAYLLGHVLDNAVMRMDKDKTTNKDFGAILQVVIESISVFNSIGPQSNATGGEDLKKLVLNIQAHTDKN